jgi:hypothetical protein
MPLHGTAESVPQGCKLVGTVKGDQAVRLRLPSVRTEQRPPLDAQAEPHSEPSQWLLFKRLLAMTIIALVMTYPR